jgi:glucokinase
MAGEVGHMAIVHGGQRCNCGRQGCWECYASATALKRLTRQAAEDHPDSTLARVIGENGGQVSGQSAFIAERLGDPVGKSVCDDYISYLGMGVVNLINIFQPDTLAIGGGVSNESDEQLLFPLRKMAVLESIPCNRDKMTRIVKAELGNNAGLIGAAMLGKKRDREKMS